MASFESVRQKVSWAYKHLQSYDSELIRYFNAEPGKIVADTESDPQGRVRIVFKEVVAVPPEIALTIGDGVQNLRSALDYLVCELVRTTNNEPTIRHMFPICDSEDAFEAQCRGHRLDWVPPEAIAQIKVFQPYHYGDKRASAPIRVLDDLCNINNHQRICFAVLSVSSSETQFTSDAHGASGPSNAP